MSKVTIDIRNISTVKALHIYLAYCLDLPSHYGRNLDALYDLLSTESRETTITLCGTGEAQGEIAAYVPRLVRVLSDAAGENERLHIIIQ